jgi:4,5-DOPA dioxygenase extradiol
MTMAVPRDDTHPLPGLFVSHGAPDLVRTDIPARRFLRSLGSALPKPRAILVISAHWLTPQLQITGAGRLETIHDYYGWPADLYEIEYPAKGAGWLHDDLLDLLNDAGWPATTGARPGLDHGAWVPLSLMYPDGGIPVVQLSLLRTDDPEAHFRVGRTLSALRAQGVLVMGSGGAVHNLRRLKPDGQPPETWARDFDDWLADRLLQRDLQSLFAFYGKAPHAQTAHPTLEHLMPLFVAMGAGWDDGTVHRIHGGFSYGNLGMACYAFSRKDSPLSKGAVTDRR